MPTSSITPDNVNIKIRIKNRRKSSLSQKQEESIYRQGSQDNNRFLTIEPALPYNTPRSLCKRSHNTLSKIRDHDQFSEDLNLYTHTDGLLYVSRSQKEKETFPDRMNLDRKGLTAVPIINNEKRLRLLSLQHNLINKLSGLSCQEFLFLVFLDVYDNQLEKIECLNKLENLRVLLMGKNRIKKIENLSSMERLEVLDLHGNQIAQVAGLESLSELKVLNLAGNQIRIIGVSDLSGLISLQELNLKRNRLRKLLGFKETTNLIKIFFSNNELQSLDDISNLAKSSTIKEITIDNNPIALEGDCMSFLVSYLPNLIKFNTMQITDQVRKAAMAWRRNKESTNTAFMDLTSDVCLSVYREKVISNAKTNWELLRTQTKHMTNIPSALDKSLKDLKPDTDFILASLNKPSNTKFKSRNSASNKAPLLPDKNLFLSRSTSQDTEHSQNTSSSTSSNDFFRLPPILIPIIDEIEQKIEASAREGSSIKLSDSLSSVGPYIDSSVSSLYSRSGSSSSESESSSAQSEGSSKEVEYVTIDRSPIPNIDPLQIRATTTDSSSNLSVESTNSSKSESENSNTKSKITRNIRSAMSTKTYSSKLQLRASTAKTRKQISPGLPSPPKDREQGGDYLIEICGRHLNIYGQGALRFIDKSWNIAKAHDVNTVKFSYISFNTAANNFNKLKQRFPNCENFIFKEANIAYLGQLNALAEVQGLSSLYIHPEGNSITNKDWQSYVIFRLSHWGLKVVNNREITEEDIKKANKEYQSLSDLVLWALPDTLLQPLLVRLRIDVNHNTVENNAKKWLLSADPALKSVVSKEVLQWKKGSQCQEEAIMRQKARHFLSGLLDEMAHAVNKLQLLEEEWSYILHQLILDTLLDYSQMEIYMKRKLQELNK